MRLQWGPHRDRSPEQVILRDPLYVIDVLDRQSASALASIFRDLVTGFDARALSATCARCGGTASDLHAYPASVDLIGYCRSCLLVSPDGFAATAARIDGYEDALRHVASSFRRGLRLQMRRIIARLVEAKGGPAVATEAACRDFLRLSSRAGQQGPSSVPDTRRA